MRNKAHRLAALVLAGFLLAGCAATDVVKKYSKTSFAAIAEAFPGIVEDKGDAYALSVEGDPVLRVSKDYSGSQEDIVIATALQPFTASGLDTAKLGDGYRVDGDRLLLTADYGDGSGAKETATDALLAAVDAKRTVLSYHTALDHYGIGLPSGKFEYAKDYKTNDKDIVFALYADPLAEAGADVKNIDGWTYVEMKGEDGTVTNVLLKPYDLTND